MELKSKSQSVLYNLLLRRHTRCLLSLINTRLTLCFCKNFVEQITLYKHTLVTYTIYNVRSNTDKFLKLKERGPQTFSTGLTKSAVKANNKNTKPPIMVTENIKNIRCSPNSWHCDQFTCFVLCAYSTIIWITCSHWYFLSYYTSS